MPNGKELMQELQALISGPESHIDEEAFRRLLLTSMVGVLTKLDSLADNPMIYFGEIIKKHPKVFWFVVVVLILTVTYVDIRGVLYQFLGIPIPNIP